MNGLGYRVLQDSAGIPYRGIDVLFLWRASYQRLGWSKEEADMKRHFIYPVMMEWFKCSVCDKQSFLECKARSNELYDRSRLEFSEMEHRSSACDLSKGGKLCKQAYFSDDFYKSRKWQKLRYSALLRYGNRCMCCGRGVYEGVILHVDHIRPKSLWPHLAYNIDNLQILCNDCNLGKGNRDRMNWKALQIRQLAAKKVSNG